MPDGALTVQLDDYTVPKLGDAAKAAGLSPEQLAGELLSTELFDYDDFTWINGDPREAMAEVSEEGARDWTEPRPEFEAYLAARLERSG